MSLGGVNMAVWKGQRVKLAQSKKTDTTVARVLVSLADMAVLSASHVTGDTAADSSKLYCSRHS